MNLDAMRARRTFAIISHPDAGKTTLTEKLLLFGGAITLAGAVKGRKADRHATSDWMAVEQQRGISVTTSVMQFPYQDCVFNLLDTPGHEDFSEDTYRTLTAVDAALMVIDAAKGVEDRTVKLMEVCRLRNTPIITFINKMDRYAKPPLELLDDIESVLTIDCAPITWPIGMGKEFQGVYHLEDDVYQLFDTGKPEGKCQRALTLPGLDNPACQDIFEPAIYDEFREQIALLQGANHPFARKHFLAAQQTPVFFGSAMNNFGVEAILQAFKRYAPAPGPRIAKQRTVAAEEPTFTGFVFKIQANMDPKHRDRIAFLRVCSGQYQRKLKMRQVRTGKTMAISNALTFLASERAQVETAWPGDIIGLPNHGTIQIGDTFTEKETLEFIGIPNFAPELFKRIRLRDPLKLKALLKGLVQLSEEGATQIFRPLTTNDIIVGAVGALQFDVVAQRLHHEYQVPCSYEAVPIKLARWVDAQDIKALAEFKITCRAQLARDASEHLTYLATSPVNLQLTQERWPTIRFMAIREH